MADILTWLSAYSLPVVLLIGLGAVLLYVAKLITDKSIARQFDKYAKVMDLQLQRRSKFEELILTERFKLLCELRSKIGNVFTNLNRMHHGTDLPGFVVDGDIVPLTEIFERINANRYLVPKNILAVLERMARLATTLANAPTADSRQAVNAELLPLHDEFDRLMVEAFGLDRIGGSD